MTGLWEVMGKDFDLRSAEEQAAFREKILEAIDDAGEDGFTGNKKSAKALRCQEQRLRKELTRMAADGLVRQGFGPKPKTGPAPIRWWRKERRTSSGP